MNTALSLELQIVPIAASMVLLQVLFLELVLRFLWNLFTLEEVVIKVLFSKL